MNAHAVTLYPFVSSGPDFAEAPAFFKALGFLTERECGGYAGPRSGGVCRHVPKTKRKA